MRFALCFALVSALVACKDEAAQRDKHDTPPPSLSGSGVIPTAAKPIGSAPPAPKTGTCEGGRGVKDPLAGAFFERVIDGYCVDPLSEPLVFGEQSSQPIDGICKQFDGGCGLYKENRIKRLLLVRYVDDAGSGRMAEVILSKYADLHGAYTLFTKRVTSGADPLDASTPKPLALAGVGAIGTGRAYIWKGQYLAELTYSNDLETPEALSKSSATMLTALAVSIAKKLPGGAELPAAAAALPPANMIPLGITYLSDGADGKGPLELGKIGPMAVGFYKEGDQRFRILSLTKASPELAKDIMKTLRSMPGSQVLATPLADEAFQSSIPSKDAPKSDFLWVRKGAQIFAVGDDEYALVAAGGKGDPARLPKDAALSKASALVGAPAVVPSASASASTRKSAHP
jgi:hypothetical protein